MKTIKKILAVALTLAMVLTIAPTFNAPVKAGDGFDIKSITHGLNEDGTIGAGKPITLKMSELKNEVDSGFETRVSEGKAFVSYGIYSTKNDFGSRVAEGKATYKDGIFTITVDSKYKGKYIVLGVDDNGGTNYGDINWYQVVDTTINIEDGPRLGDIYATKTFLKKNITVNVYGKGRYTLDKDPTVYYVDKTIVKLFKNGKLYATKTTSGGAVVFNSVPVSYGKKDTFKVALYMNILGTEIAGPTNTFSLTSEKIPNIKVFATKISAKKAYLRWQSVGGVYGYYIYMGKKKVKTVGAKTTKKMISKKKAGKSKFRVVPFVKVGKSVYKSTSNKAKPKKNQAKWYRNLNVKSRRYATCDFEVTKISLSGKTYKVTGYALNNRIFKVKKYKSLTLGLRVDGKKAFSKKIKNVKLNIGREKKRKFTFKIKGKAGRDLANGTLSLTVGQDPDWGFKDE